MGEKFDSFDGEEDPYTLAMTSYALLSHFLSDEASRNFDSNIPIVEWLFTQQNNDGGFASTSDTYVALMALREFSRKLRIPDRGSKINLQYSFENTVRRVEISADSSTLL